MINIPSAVKISLRALRVNKMRSGLTMLGMIIGVTAVIAMLAVGGGAKSMIGNQIASMGSNLIIILPGASTSGGVRMSSGTTPTLSMKDAEAILKSCPAVADVAPGLGGVAQVVYRHQNWSTFVNGTTPSVLDIRDWSLSAGRPFTDQEVKTAATVALLGQMVVDNLFGDVDPVGQIVRIKGIPFQVIGVLAAKGQSIMGQDQDDTVFVPITTAQRKLFGTAFPGMVRAIAVKAKTEDALSDAEEQITQLLKQRHHIGPNQDADFSVRNLTSMMEAAQSAANTMTILLGAIASVSLLVGGIGIMNIMLVSVTERTREIGIRMAVGAKTWDIRLQFIIEAVILSLFGGTIGILVGSIGSKVTGYFIGWPMVISPLSVMLSFGFSALIGIFFGFYPAYKASLLNPIEALRYE